MKFKLLITGLLLSIISCSQKEPQVTVHKSKMVEGNSHVDFGKVENEIDPICNMKTEGHVSDTVVYKNKVYGFCSSYCKDEFKKDPEKYVINKK